MRLGARLQAIAGFVRPGMRLADIGTDHAYLPIYLVKQGIVPWAIAGEVNKGPFRAAQQAIENERLADKISLRLGNGLSVINSGEVDAAVIAGMGGATIVEILQEASHLVKSLLRIIAQPMVASAAVRHWFINNGWQIIDETLVMDEGRLYEIIVAEPSDAPLPLIEPILYEIGPILWNSRHALLAMHIEQLIGQTQRILQEMDLGKSKSPKYYSYVEKLKQLEARKACL